MDLPSPDNLMDQPSELPSPGSTVAPPERPAWFNKSSAKDTDAGVSDQDVGSASEPLSEEPPEQSDQAKSRRKKLARVASVPKVNAAPEEEEPPKSLQQTLKFWLVSIAAGSYGMSLILHLFGLGIMSVWYVYDEIISEATIVTVLPSSELDDLDFEEVFDAKMDAVQQNESAPSVLSQLVPTQKDSDRFIPQDVNTGFAQKDGAGDNLADGFSDSFKFRMPSNGKAIVKGSFAAWTVPDDPRAGQDYKIIIQIKVPKRLRRYRVTDLSGQVVGTDGFRHIVPYDKKRPNATKTERGGSLTTVTTRSYLPIKNGVAQLIIDIPGAAKLVEDTIKIKSRALKETQDLKIVF